MTQVCHADLGRHCHTSPIAVVVWTFSTSTQGRSGPCSPPHELSVWPVPSCLRVHTTLWRERHAWVLTFDDDCVQFHEPFLGTGSCMLEGRLAHPEVLNGVLSPCRVNAVAEPGRARAPSVRGACGSSFLLPAGRHHHQMVYADCSTFVSEDTGCAICMAAGVSENVRGSHCSVCLHVVCWSFAEIDSDDVAKLKGVKLDLAQPIDFEEGHLPHCTIEAGLCRLFSDDVPVNHRFLDLGPYPPCSLSVS